MSARSAIFFAVHTWRTAPETFVAIVAIALLAVVLDAIWTRDRDRRGTPARPGIIPSG